MPALTDGARVCVCDLIMCVQRATSVYETEAAVIYMSMHGSAGDAVMHACASCAYMCVQMPAGRSCTGQQHCAVQRVCACIETVYDVHNTKCRKEASRSTHSV